MASDRGGARLFAWIEAHHPRAGETLRGPAAAEQLAAVESALGASLPEELRELYLAHDGQERTVEPLGVFGRWSWIPLSQCLEVQRGVRSAFAAPATWLPIGVDGGGDYLVVDLAAGTVIEWLRSDDAPAPSEPPPPFGVWLTRHVERLERGEITIGRAIAAGASETTNRAPVLALGVGALVLVIALVVFALARR